MTSVLFIVTEAAPFVKTGGLGEVCGSLPRELVKQGIDARVIIPKFSAIAKQWQEKMSFLGSITVNLGWRKQFCGLHTLTYEGVQFYFIDNEHYFNRPGLYGFTDDAERFAYFSRAVLEALPCLDFSPEILHCHDWQTAMVPVLLKTHYAAQVRYAGLRSLLTIHNAEYQGIFPRTVVSDLLDLPDAEYFTADRLEYYGSVNYLKSGIVFADAISTVSNTYAQEITTPEGGWGLDGVLRSRQSELHGIVNGIDYEIYDPATDALICSNYSWRITSGKQKNKLKLQEYLGLTVSSTIPLIGMVSRLTPTKGFDIIVAALPKLLNMGLQMVFLGQGDAKYVDMLKLEAHKYQDQLWAQTYFEETMAHRIFAGSDLYLHPSLSEPCGISQLMAMRYGSVPIVRETGGLKDTVIPFDEAAQKGTGFSFREANSDAMFHAVERAIAVYNEKPAWQNLVKAAMKVDHSWRRSVGQYLKLYSRLKKRERKCAARKEVNSLCRQPAQTLNRSAEPRIF